MERLKPLVAFRLCCVCLCCLPPTAYSSQTYTDYVNAVGAKRSTIALGQVIDLGGGAINGIPRAKNSVTP